MEDIEHYEILVYSFPYDVEDDDEETIQDNSELPVRVDYPSVSQRFLSLPSDFFLSVYADSPSVAVIGSEEVEIDGQPVRAGMYPGVLLRNALLNSHLADLESLTHNVLYETYRTEQLSRTVHTDTHNSSILLEGLAKEESLRNFESRLAAQGSQGEFPYDYVAMTTK